MNVNGWIQLALFSIILVALTKPMGHRPCQLTTMLIIMQFKAVIIDRPGGNAFGGLKNAR
jgi:hypothetical protein